MRVVRVAIAACIVLVGLALYWWQRPITFSSSRISLFSSGYNILAHQYRLLWFYISGCVLEEFDQLLCRYWSICRLWYTSYLSWSLINNTCTIIIEILLFETIDIHSLWKWEEFQSFRNSPCNSYVNFIKFLDG